MKIINSLFLLILITASISAQSVASEAKISADIRKVMDDQSVAWNKGDIDGFMKGYWKSEKLVFVSGDNVTYGWQPTLDRYKKNYDSKSKMGTLSFTGLEIEVISKDAAVVLGNWALERTEDKPHGKFTLIFRKFKDGWRIIHDHTS